MPLKVFGTALFATRREVERLGLPAHARQVRAIVAAPSRKAAAELFGITMHTARGFMGETGNSADIEQAMSAPGTVFVMPLYREGPVIERPPRTP